AHRTAPTDPAYQSKSPRYCLLVFGPKAETRVWLVLDLVSEPWEADGAKNALYVDRNGNGDLTDPSARVACTMCKRPGPLTSFCPEPGVTYVPQFKVREDSSYSGGYLHDYMRTARCGWRVGAPSSAFCAIVWPQRTPVAIVHLPSRSSLGAGPQKCRTHGSALRRTRG